MCITFRPKQYQDAAKTAKSLSPSSTMSSSSNNSSSCGSKKPRLVKRRRSSSSGSSTNSNRNNNNTPIVVTHDYHDHSNDVQEDDDNFLEMARAGPNTPFPIRLYDVSSSLAHFAGPILHVLYLTHLCFFQIMNPSPLHTDVGTRWGWRTRSHCEVSWGTHHSIGPQNGENSSSKLTPFIFILSTLRLCRSWLPHGRAFLVHKPDEFKDLLPRFFKLSKIPSFQRQLNLYGFNRLTRISDRGAYYHEVRRIEFYAIRLNDWLSH